MSDLEKILRPQSIVLIGVSRKEGSLGKKFLDAILRMNFKGKIFIVNPKADQISGIKCYPELKALPERPDLAVVLLPYMYVLDSLKALGEVGVKDVIVVSAGFKEVGGEGVEREKALIKIAQDYNMNVLGPNCMGIFNTDPKVSFNGTFSPTLPNPGHVAYISQSGALGVAIMELAADSDLGFSVFVSTGNKAVIADHDVLNFLKDDDNTHVVTLYLESIDNPTSFRRVAEQVAQKKPVLAVKAGRTESGKRAASSHTGALANPEYVMDGFLKQCGVLRCETLEEMFDVARAFAAQPLPKGANVAIITNAGGPGILASDSLELNGLQLATFSESTVKKLKEILPEEAACTNPVDMIASATHETYRNVVEIVAKDDNVDSIVLIIVKPPVDTTPEKIARNLAPVLSDCKKTVLPVLMARHDKSAGLDVFKELRLPIFSYPETAVKALGTMWRYRQVQKRLKKSETLKSTGIKTKTEHKSTQVRQMQTGQLLNLLKEYEIPVASCLVSESLQELVQFIKNKRAPVVLKIANENIVHKSDLGLVRLNIQNEKELEDAVVEMAKIVEQKIEGKPLFLIQKQLAAGLELVLGGKRDDEFGAIFMVGLGGILVEAIKDVSFRVAPVDAMTAAEMLDELKSQKLLNGFRNIPPVPREQLIKLIQNLSQLLIDHPEIVEMDLNPLIWTEGLAGPVAVDFRATVRV